MIEAKIENDETEMANKLVQAGKKAERAKKERLERVVKGSHLLEPIKARIEKAGLVTENKSGFIKVTGRDKGNKIYVALKGGRVDLSGFVLENEAVVQVTEDEAKEKHLGKVRGQLDFSKTDVQVFDALELVLEVLLTPPPAPAPKAVRQVKPKSTTPPEGLTQTSASADEGS